MIATLGIEAIGDDARDRARARRCHAVSEAEAFRRAITSGRAGAMMRDAIRYDERPRAWVARIVGRDAKFGLAREFMPFNRDYSEANELGSRGVFQWYELPEGELFEVNAPQSWTHADRYFCRSERGRVVRMTREEIDAALDARSMIEIATVSL